MSFFSRIPVDKQLIEEAITRLEKQTSAELRVYIERTIPAPEGMDSEDKGSRRALQVFYELAMDKTAKANGVLIYLAYKDHYCQVVGDKGIDQYVGDEFWQTVCSAMIYRFKQRQYTEGIIAAIERVGRELAKYFPIEWNDENELSNEVVIND